MSNSPTPSRPSAFSAVRWVLFGNVLQSALGFVGLAIIGRLAGAEKVGIYQQLYSFHLVLNMLLPFGFDFLVVREEANRERYVRALRAMLWVSFFSVSALILAGHYTLTTSFDLGDHDYLAWFLPIVLLSQAIKWGIRPVLNAEMAFKRISGGESLRQIVTLCGGAVIVYFWNSPAALYTAYAVSEYLELFWMWRGRGLFATLAEKPDWPILRELFARHRKFCVVMCADQGLNSASNNSPALMLGGLLGPGASGVFGIANRLIYVPMSMMMGAVGRVTLPALAGRPEEELQHRLLLTLRGCAAFIPPGLIWLAFFATDVVAIMLGKDNFAESAPLIQWMVLYLILQSLFSPVSVIDVLRDRPDVTMWWNFANLLVGAVTMFIGAKSGLDVVGTMKIYAMITAVMWIIYGMCLAWLLRAGQWRFLNAWLRFVPLWFLLAGGFWASRHAMDQHVIIEAAVSALPCMVYMVLVWVIDREAAELFLRLGFLKRRREP